MAKHLDRWGDRLTDPSLRIMRPASSNIVVDWDGDTIYSYGHHFPLAHVQRTSPDAPARLVILNGDSYSVTTAQHQSKVREAVRQSGVPSVTIPFSALRAAGINLPLPLQEESQMSTVLRLQVGAGYGQARAGRCLLRKYGEEKIS